MKVNIVVLKRHLLPLFYTIDAQKKSFFTIVFDETVQTYPFLIYSGHESRRDNSILRSPTEARLGAITSSHRAIARGSSSNRGVGKALDACAGFNQSE
jgi:hypothetical protein